MSGLRPENVPSHVCVSIGRTLVVAAGFGVYVMLSSVIGAGEVGMPDGGAPPLPMLIER
jgi:hypothetical protein